MSYPGTNNGLNDFIGNAAFGAVTALGEQVTASRIADLYINPTWGVSVLRDITATAGAGFVDESAGALRVGTTVAAADSASLTSLARINYAAGTQGQFGIGVRMSAAAANNQEARWGLYDSANGFGFGSNSTGSFVFYRTGGATTDIPQASWNIDKLDGTGPSGLTLSDFTSGHIFQIDFLWYGYGPITWSIYVFSADLKTVRKVPVHSFTPSTSLSIVDPNQPINVEVANGAAGGEFIAYVGGRQFSAYGGQLDSLKRKVTQPNYSVVLAANPTWTPLISVRRKATFGPSGRANSVRAVLTEFEVMGSADIELRMTLGDTVNAGVWTTADGVAASESAVEVQNNPTISATGTVVQRGLLGAVSGRGSSVLESQDQVELGGTVEATLWARPLGAGTPTLTAIFLAWQEQW